MYATLSFNEDFSLDYQFRQKVALAENKMLLAEIA